MGDNRHQYNSPTCGGEIYRWMGYTVSNSNLHVERQPTPIGRENISRAVWVIGNEEPDKEGVHNSYQLADLKV